MQPDRELLELAAKAAGITTRIDSDTGEFLVDCKSGLPGHQGAIFNRPWNPLTDDGDALRLAVRLGMTVAPFPAGARARYQNHILDTCEVEVHNPDPYAATRRAIVRAAAEIGASL